MAHPFSILTLRSGGCPTLSRSGRKGGPPANRLSSVGIPSYQYNASNELTSSSSGGYSYDNNGNTMTDASGKSYAWDFENRLVSTVVPGTGTVAFKYDPFGRRIQKSSPLGTTNYLYDGPNLIEEVDNSRNIVARYTQGIGVDQPLAESRSAPSSYYEADGLGSVSSLSNEMGALVNTYVYDSFGRQTTSTYTLTNPLHYTGREFDSETGLYYYRARYYDSVTGRFLSEDPARSDLNLFYMSRTRLRISSTQRVKQRKFRRIV